MGIPGLYPLYEKREATGEPSTLLIALLDTTKGVPSLQMGLPDICRRVRHVTEKTERTEEN